MFDRGTQNNSASDSVRHVAVHKAFEDALIEFAGRKEADFFSCISDRVCQQTGPQRDSTPVARKGNLPEDVQNLARLDRGAQTSAFASDLADLSQMLEQVHFHFKLAAGSPDGTISLFDPYSTRKYDLIQEDGFPTIKPHGGSDKQSRENKHFSASPQIGDIGPDHVVQGNLADCYFMAPLAGLAAADSEFAAKMIKVNRDGSNTITFPGDPSHPVSVSAPNEAELQVFAHYSEGDWANLMEKAHRKLTGKSLIDFGQGAKNTLHLLTGKSPNEILIDSLRKRKTLPELESTLAAVLDHASKTRSITVAGTGIANPMPHGLLPGHWYTVLGYDSVKQMVTLRNPLGEDWNSGIVGSRTRPGVFEMSLHSFSQNFSALATVQF